MNTIGSAAGVKKAGKTDSKTLDRVQDFMQQTIDVRLKNDLNEAVSLLLEAGGKLLGASIGYGGERAGNVFQVRHRLKEGVVGKFRIPLVLEGASFLKDMFEADIPYIGNEPSMDPMVPSILKTVFYKNVIGIPVTAGSSQFGFLFSGIPGNSVDVALAQKQYIEIFHLQASATLANLASQTESKHHSETEAAAQLKDKEELHRYLEETLRKREPHELTLMLLIDIDQLKEINEKYGRPAGDSAIQAVKSCLCEIENDKCKTFRIDSDEFMVVINVVSPLKGLRLAEEIQKKLSVFKMPGGSITVSIGVSYCGSDSNSFEELLEGAEEALGRAKSSGTSTVEINRMLT
jgi:diguanylate cyclase (GGDEF)-like protein